MSKRTAALELAGLGWRLIPIFWVEQDQKTYKFSCGCGNPLCTAPGKHPLMKMGKDLANATSDLRVVSAWWEQWPEANIAVACGKDSGVVVIDCDTKTTEAGGAHEFEAWLAGQGLEVPATMSARTGGGGVHYIFQYPNDGIPIKNCVSWLPDVDVKSDGGYILVAPSVHVSGVGYEWMSLAAPAPLPSVIANSVRTSKSGGGPRKRRQGARDGDAEVGDEGAYDYRDAVRNGARRGTRDDAFNSRAYELRKVGWEWDDAVEDLHRMWTLTEGISDPRDPFPWDLVLEKAKRIWEDDSIIPEPLPDWDPNDPLSTASAPVRQIIIEGRPQDMCTDRGNAYVLVTRFKDEIKYTPALGWLVWDRYRWIRDENEKVMEYAGKVVDYTFQSAVKEPEDARDRLLKWASVSSSSQRLTAMVRVTSTYDFHKVRLSEFDTDPWILVTPNGTLDLKTGDLRPASRDDLATKASPVEYNPDATDPMWDAYLWEACNADAELISYLKRAVGYSLTGLTSEEAMFLLYGPKASGKTTLVNAITTILGDYALSTQPENLMHRKGQSIPKDEIARMRGMRLVTSVEPQHGDRFAEGLLKQMTGGDKMSGRFLYKDTFEFTPTHKLWIASNTKPRAGDDALFRRLKLLPFPVTVPFERRNHRLKMLLADPTSNLTQAAFAWAVQGCLEWQQYGLGTAMVVEQETAQYQEDEDTVGQFMRECTAQGDASDIIKAKDVYAIFAEWSNERGERPMSYQSLNKSLEERGVKFTLEDRQKATVGMRLSRAVWTGGV